MRDRLHFQKRLTLSLFGLFLLAGALESSAAVSKGGPLRVHILYDNSGSMYPGYRPPGTPGRKTKSELGARFYYEDPEFQSWLGDFVACQTILDGGTVGLWTFTSNGEFTPGGIQRVHPEVPVAQFDVARAVRNFPSEAGQTTYLTETLDQFTRGFEGLIWLITDNIVETRVGEPDQDVERFFQALRHDPRYQSVHLFKHSFQNERSALAIYGILVSGSEIDKSVLAYYDRKFRSNFRFANRREGDPPPQLFPGREHLKLRNLEIDALELVPNLQAVLADSKSGLFKEGDKVKLELAGEIKSYLTQHAVTSGRYRLEFSENFKPDRIDLAPEIPSQSFTHADGEIQEAIQPNGTRNVREILQSSKPISFTSKGLASWFTLALKGALVNYSGTVKMSFWDVKVRLERAQMAGIFGIDKASRIFDFQNVTKIEVYPSQASVTFALQTGSSRTALLLTLLLILAVILGLLAAFLARKQWYRIRITGTPERLIPLRRLGSYQILHEGQTLGRLTRGISGDYDFAANLNSAAFTIAPTRQADTWDVRFRDGGGCQLSIEPQGGRTEKHRGRDDADSTRPGAPAGGMPAAPPAPLRPLPKIDRPKKFSWKGLVIMRNRAPLHAQKDLGRHWLPRAFGLLWTLLLAAPLAAQETASVPAYAQPDNLLLRWAGVIVVLIGIWFILYKVVYPFFLHYYRDDFCKTIFWNLLLLYSFTWLFLSSYILLEFGFYYGWMQWIAIFLGVLWLISGLALLLRRNPA